MDESSIASTKLYVGNLFYGLTLEDLEAEFGKVRRPLPFLLELFCHLCVVQIKRSPGQKDSLKLTVFYRIAPLFLSPYLFLLCTSLCVWVCVSLFVPMIFHQFGPLEQCAVKKGYAFVHFERLEDAEMAVQEMNDKELGGRRLRVAFAVSHGTQRRYDGPPPPLHAVPPGPPPMMQQPLDPIRPSPLLLHNPRMAVNASPNLFVANIPPHVKMSELDDAFARFGDVKNVKVLPQSRPDAPMSAFVDYTDVSSAQKAHSATIVMDGQQLRTDYNFRKYVE